MRPVFNLAVMSAAATLLFSADVRASGFLRFQHLGPGTAEAGATVARADDASAVGVNPAAIAHLPGLQIAGGLDFNAADDEYDGTGGASARHHIQFPPALYGTWHAGKDRVPFAFGIGIDAPAWYVLDWTPALFPGRFLAFKGEVTLFQIHPVVAYEISDAASVGAGVRYVRGTYGFGDNAVLTLPSGAGTTPVEVDRLAEASVDGVGVDAGAHLQGKRWGAGLVYRSKVDLDGDGDVSQHGRDVPPDPVLQQSLAHALRGRSARLALTLPAELAIGFHVRPAGRLVLELDAVRTQWSGFDDDVAYAADAFGRPPRDRGWDDTTSLRLGTRVGLSDHWRVHGGLALEPSPVPDGRVDPAFPRGDDRVAAAGFSYEAGGIAFDVAYSLHLYADRSVRGQEADPSAGATYATTDQVFAASIRFRRD